eukprot:TRINITY_DN2152_c0_g1_i3.p1 TRINITY_DN2152_c0_g1~~TRINITY_DN2152_c0_g1_i3.p1  ORF type:complete len:223 (-),score=0.96 TRINITY_DN2152_c0_g1_i3:82-750(-)
MGSNVLPPTTGKSPIPILTPALWMLILCSLRKRKMLQWPTTTGFDLYLAKTFVQGTCGTYFSILARFSFMVETGNAEAFDLRLGKLDSNGNAIGEGDILFFRAGYYNYTRINREQMAFRHSVNNWYRIDIKFNWDDYKVDLFHEYKRIETVDFYRKDRNVEDFDHVNVLYIYALTPKSSFAIKELKLCSEWPCPGDESAVYSFGARSIVGAMSVLAVVLLIL